MLDDGSGALRRVRIHCLARASLLLGAADGVFDEDGTELAVQAVERTVFGFVDQFVSNGERTHSAGRRRYSPWMRRSGAPSA